MLKRALTRFLLMERQGGDPLITPVHSQWLRGVKTRRQPAELASLHRKNIRSVSRVAPGKISPTPPPFIPWSGLPVPNAAKPSVGMKESRNIRFPTPTIRPAPCVNSGNSVGGGIFSKGVQKLLDEKLARVRAGEKGLLTKTARIKLDVAINTDHQRDWFTAWGQVGESILRMDAGFYKHEYWGNGIDEEIPSLARPFHMVWKASPTGSMNIALIIIGDADHAQETFVKMEENVMEGIQHLHEVRCIRDETTFVAFRGPSFYWGVARLGQTPVRRCEITDIREPAAEEVLEQLAKHLCAL
ncbi:uncharacterized protein LOC129599441 [Paramacrobiotus metropolitanus]|uniref:uncharacterized protein LOC129599441 n=1 Tax=Paramacrobiotus metropolitanus TaxID=2943436 RepID=UPI0024458FDE|nr:uncharacterized protein LOC129599441 [Paramacrobiotus metropolitanus]